MYLQERFLTSAREERRPVTVFLMNGFQLRGHICGHDPDAILLCTEGKQQFIFKHAISTIAPERPLELGPGVTA